MEKTGEVALARTLGLGSIVLLGIGALLGGGIFTLLGPAAGLAGPGLFLAMLLGGGVAFLNLQMYIALGTTFPEAGGGYLWVKKGLGDFQGFLAGWMSWFGHLAAAGLYALSFGFYAHEFLKFAGIDLGIPSGGESKIFAVLVVLVFGYLNWRGAKSTGSTGNWITIALVVILGLFIITGTIHILTNPELLQNYTPFLPAGFIGVLAAASFFYIAFEGSEIQVQAAEETKDPQRTIKKALVRSWAIVSIVYVLVSLVFVGIENWKDAAVLGEGAIAVVTGKFLPFGNLLMVIGGILANIAALNATIYSSSRVSYALARDKTIWSRLSDIHLENFTPYLAVIVSTILIAVMVVILPLFDVASAASLLFVLLFLQLNIAGIRIHYKWPDTPWYYRIPFFPVTPIIATVIYAILAVTMLSVNLTAWLVIAFWVLLGFVNYFAYTETRSREDFETGIVYEEAVRIGPKTGKRILLPLAPGLAWEEIKNLSEIAFSLASKFDGELIIVRVHEVPPAMALHPNAVGKATLDQEKELFEKLQNLVTEYNIKTGPAKKDINFHSLILIGRDVVDVILDVIKMEDCDLLMMNWQGYVQAKGAILGRRIDRILREAKCDLLVIKNPKPINSILLAIHPSAKSPYLELMGEITTGLVDFYKSKVELFSVIAQNVPAYLKPDPTMALKRLQMKRKDFSNIIYASEKSVVSGILKEADQKQSDLIIVGASLPKILKEIRFGTDAEMIVKQAKTSVMIVRGHQGPAETFIRNLLNKFSTPKELAEKV